VKTSFLTVLLLFVGRTCLGMPSAPGLEVRVFLGDPAKQDFRTLVGRPLETKPTPTGLSVRYELRDESGGLWRISFEAEMSRDGDSVSWRYRTANQQAGATVCRVVFPIVRGVLIGGKWADNRILWPGKYVGARIDGLKSAEEFARQCRDACKGVSHLHGMYQGDLCLPFFVQTGKDAAFSVMVCDPTHEVIALDGYRRKDGMEYRVTTTPRVPFGAAWTFGEVKVITLEQADWHVVADRYRDWLVQQDFRPPVRHGDIAALMYGRWDGLKTGEAIRWAKALDIRDVCLWVVLYGKGDRYYPCYFPPPELGVSGLKAKLDVLRKAGLSPYFYTNHYLLSPLQTEADAQEWTSKYPEKYPRWLARNDHGYAETAKRFRARHPGFAGKWLETPGGILPLRVRRVDYHWGEYPMYFWHRRPFWAACVATPQWQKLFEDVAALHARLGAGGIYVDQIAAIRPELCSAAGHGHDTDSFGFWNRASLRLLRRIRREGEKNQPGFFIEAEGATDLYAKYIDRYLCNFKMPDPKSTSWPRLFRYTVPWARFDVGNCGYQDADKMKRHVEETLLLGCIFRASGGTATGPEPRNDPRLRSDAVQLLKAAIQTRRRLGPFIDKGRFMDDVGLKTTGCSKAAWFDGENGVLIAVKASGGDATVGLTTDREDLNVRSAAAIDWQTGRKRRARTSMTNSVVSVTGLEAGFNLVVIPAKSTEVTPARQPSRVRMRPRRFPGD